MNSIIMTGILAARLSSGRTAEITVTGSSMNPVLFDGDIITVVRESSYAVGDILVFMYKGTLVVHRLLKISYGRYFCKGDNAFRLEDFPAEEAIGKAISSNGQALPDYPDELIKLSLLVNREFHKCAFNPAKTKETEIYKEYERKRNAHGKGSAAL